MKITKKLVRVASFWAKFGYRHLDIRLFGL